MRRRIRILIIVVWAILTAGMAYSYVTERIRLDDAVGYEQEWDWQLFFFSVTRLPILVAGLCLALWLESKLLRI